uniref:Lipoprotein n=1 Tax=Geobacter metallireducens TaxID=28232 RepID=A0A831XGT5_GEOME
MQSAQSTTMSTRWLKGLTALIAMLLAGMLAGCAASRSPVTGKFDRPAERNAGAEKVRVFFLFRHLEQQHGFDSIPKLKAHGVKDFDNLFRNALGEISNVSPYVTFTESPADVNNPKRREELDTFRRTHDYTLDIDFFEESSFAEQCLSGTISLLSLTLIPMPYTWDYTITANLSDKSGKAIRSYQRKATLKNWTQAVLIFAYPFHPLEGKREEIYAESLHDIFRQIEAERVLKK